MRVAGVNERGSVRLSSVSAAVLGSLELLVFVSLSGNVVSLVIQIDRRKVGPS